MYLPVSVRSVFHTQLAGSAMAGTYNNVIEAVVNLLIPSLRFLYMPYIDSPYRKVNSPTLRKLL